jgi:hypothetical protein
MNQHPHTRTLTDRMLEASARRRARLRALWLMTPAQRVTAMRRGDLNLEQLAAWTARFPQEVPLLNGEFEWLAIHEAEAAEAE